MIIKKIKKILAKKDSIKKQKQSKVNPYDFINPNPNSNKLFGRVKELEEIEYYLKLSLSDDPQYTNMSLIGKRSAGKTSLLNVIKEKSEVIKTSYNVEELSGKEFDKERVEELF